jgi:hypothetical protein
LSEILGVELNGAPSNPEQKGSPYFLPQFFRCAPLLAQYAFVEVTELVNEGRKLRFRLPAVENKCKDGLVEALRFAVLEMCGRLISRGSPAAARSHIAP